MTRVEEESPFEDIVKLIYVLYTVTVWMLYVPDIQVQNLNIDC